MKAALLTFLVLVFHPALSKQAKFVFVNEPRLSDSKAVRFYNSMEITVNGVALSEQDKVYKVNIHTNAIDTIKVKAVYGSRESWIILARLNAGVVYKITYNQCSDFEIIPSKKKDGIKLVRLVGVNRENQKLFLNSNYCFIDTTQLWRQDTTGYFMNATNGNCPYAPVAFEMCSKDISEISSEEDRRNCHGIMLYFSGNEMFTLVYDYKSNKMTAKFEGYYHDKMNIRVEVINSE